MPTIRKQKILLVVKSPQIASMLSQHLSTCDVMSFFGTRAGERYDLIAVMDVIDTLELEQWVDFSLRPLVAKNGRLFQAARVVVA